MTIFYDSDHINIIISYLPIILNIDFIINGFVALWNCISCDHHYCCQLDYKLFEGNAHWDGNHQKKMWTRISQYDQGTMLNLFLYMNKLWFWFTLVLHIYC